ncbi:MAG: VWA domain-containing protein [Flavobacterium sp.]|uniref:vWA domain-containing protein n=1 Tax=Flavobacterium sp. TaxID=239 RepID=UPI002622F816|nr:vWA domain-containing protein [Flavobacterium sp.]MDD5151286.1 VWA domain-containing protein [Flavobacterium sp.]
MKQGLTDITLVIDESYSMMNTWQEVITGINKFLIDQSNVQGEANITLIKFDDQFSVVYEAVDIKKAPKLTKEIYKPRGSTALLDAMCKSIDITGERLAAMPEHERPEKVIILFQTDGEENSSVLFKKEDIDKKIKHQKEVYNWEFIFLGANQDAISTGISLGLSVNASITYNQTANGTLNAFACVSETLTNYRGSGNISFDDTARSKAMAE